MEAEEKIKTENKMKHVENFYEDILYDLSDSEEKGKTINGIDSSSIVKPKIITNEEKNIKIDIGKILNFFHPERKCAYSDKEDDGLLWIDTNRKNILITNLIRVNTDYQSKIGIGKFVYISRSEDIDLGIDNIIVNYKTLLPCSIDGQTYLNDGFNQYVTSIWKKNIQENIKSGLPKSYVLIYLWKVFSHIFKIKGLREITLSIKNESPVTSSVSYSMNYMEFLNITNNALFDV